MTPSRTEQLPQDQGEPEQLSGFSMDVAEMARQDQNPQQQAQQASTSSSLDSSVSSIDSMNQLSLPRTASSQSSRSSLTDSSVETPTIPSILKSSAYFTMAPRATPSTSTISFAPLPDLAPRKRKSTVQLGVAARSSMLRSRRMFMVAQEEAMRIHDAEHEGLSGPVEVKSPSDSAVMYVHGGTRGPRMVGGGGWHSEAFEPDHTMNYLPPDPGLAEDAVEDAFLALGRMVKGAGKSLWKKMSVSRRSSVDDVSRGREEDEEKPAVPSPGKDEKKKRQGSIGKRFSKGFNGDVATVLASEGGANAVSLQAILEEEKSRRPNSSPAHDPASETEEEVADIVLTDPNAPHPSEDIELPDTLPPDFLNITQPSDEPCPPTSLPDLADDTDSDVSHSTAGQFELPATPPTELLPDRIAATTSD